MVVDSFGPRPVKAPIHGYKISEPDFAALSNKWYQSQGGLTCENISGSHVDGGAC
jgi:hypothetical protein